MAVYTLTFQVSQSGVTPSEVQFAGYSGDHRAARVSFVLDAALRSGYNRTRVEITDGTGGYDITDTVTVSGNTCTVDIPSGWTAAGVAALRLCLVQANSDGEETASFHSAPAYLRFAERDDGAPIGEAAQKAWQQLITKSEAVLQQMAPYEVQQNYDAESVHPQSGTAVSQAVKQVIDTLKRPPSDWQEIKQLVRRGYGPAYFPIGYEFPVTNLVTGVTAVWRVVGHDCHTPADRSLQHSMTLECKYLYSHTPQEAYARLPFSGREAIYTGALPAGQYYVELPSVPEDQYGFAGHTVSFTLTKALPETGLLLFESAIMPVPSHCGSLVTYAGPQDTQPLETVTGTFDVRVGTQLPLGQEVCRNFYGNNNYAQSAVRQWLNSEASYSVIVGAGRAGRRVSEYDGMPGFMYGLPADFLQAVEPAEVLCHTNVLYETVSRDGTSFACDRDYTVQDRFFPLSKAEIFGDGQTKPLPFYRGVTQEMYRKYTNGGGSYTAQLRDALPEHVGYISAVAYDGTYWEIAAREVRGIAPACIVA